MSARADESLPINVELEQEVLGGVLLTNEVYWRVAAFLEPRHFSEPIHQAIWEVTGEMLRAGRPASVLTIRSYLPADLPLVEGVTLSQYLARLAASAAGSVAAEGAAREVHRLAVMRALIATGEDAAFRAKRVGPDGLAGLVSNVSAELFDLAEELGAADAGPAQVGYADVVAEAEARMLSGKSSRGVPTGMVGLDYKLGGLMAGDLNLLAARPSMGKTACALSIARRAAFTGHGVLFHSIEMSAMQCKARLLSDECEGAGHTIPYQNIDRKRIDAEDVAYLRLASDRLDKLPLMIIDRGSRLSDVAGHIRAGRKWLRQRGVELELYVLDYLGLVVPADRYKGSRTNEVGEISAALKRLAKEEQIPILALHQLSRQNETRKDRRPQLQDLRDSGALEQDADVVMFVYRDSYYLERSGGGDDAAAEVDRLNKLHDVAAEMELIVAKQRQGAVGTVKLWCKMATNSVRDASWY